MDGVDGVGDTSIEAVPPLSALVGAGSARKYHRAFLLDDRIMYLFCNFALREQVARSEDHRGQPNTEEGQDQETNTRHTTQVLPVWPSREILFTEQKLLRHTPKHWHSNICSMETNTLPSSLHGELSGSDKSYVMIAMISSTANSPGSADGKMSTTSEMKVMAVAVRGENRCREARQIDLIDADCFGHHRLSRRTGDDDNALAASSALRAFMINSRIVFVHIRVLERQVEVHYRLGVDGKQEVPGIV